MRDGAKVHHTVANFEVRSKPNRLGMKVNRKHRKILKVNFIHGPEGIKINFNPAHLKHIFEGVLGQLRAKI